MKNKPALLLYFIACLVFIVSVVFEDSELMLVSKPIIVPSIFFYYIQEKKGKINWTYVIITLLFFIGDMIILIDAVNLFIAVVSVFLLAYLLYLKGVVDDLVIIRVKHINKMHLFTLSICIFFLFYLLLNSLNILIESKMQNMWLFVIYGLVLMLIGVVSALNYIICPSKYTIFMILASLSFVISDIFYIFKKNFVEIEIFTFLNNSTQVLSYYFLTKYYILKKTDDEIESG